MKRAGTERQVSCRRLLPPWWQGRTVAAVLLWLGIASAVAPLRGAEAARAGEWSADLLRQILQEPAPAPQPGRTAPGPQEMVLRTYRLSHLRIGESGKVQNVLAILGNLLPPGSSMKPDVSANSVHVLTTEAAHKAVWDYLSAVDVEPTATAPAKVPDEVKQALTKLAATGDQTAKLLRALGALQSDVARHFAEIDARQREQLRRLIAAGIGLAVLLVGTIGWMVRRHARAASARPYVGGTELVLAPDQLASALTPVNEQMRSSMLGLLNEVAIKLQAQHNEQQRLVHEQQQQLEEARHALADERRQFISEAGTMVVQAVERVDATTAKLARQQDKVAELVQELQSTVRELDETKDSLRRREVELEQERAKIAALSILLEEGGAVAPVAAALNGHATPEPSVRPVAVNGGTAFETPCTMRIQTPTSLPTEPDPTLAPAERRFTFLPPDHPET